MKTFTVTSLGKYELGQLSSKAHSELYQIFKMDRFAKIISDFPQLTIFTKRSFLVV